MERPTQIQIYCLWKRKILLGKIRTLILTECSLKLTAPAFILVFQWVHGAESLVFCVVLSVLLVVFVFFVKSLYCLTLYIWFLMTLLVLSHCSWLNKLIIRRNALIERAITQILTEFGTALTTILPILFQYCYKYCYSDSRNL